MLLDFKAEMDAVRANGREDGEQIGRIQLCEQLLQRPVTPRERLASLSLEDLTRVADDLQAQVLRQR